MKIPILVKEEKKAITTDFKVKRVIIDKSLARFIKRKRKKKPVGYKYGNKK